MKRYSIMVREVGRDHERELCQVDRNPEAIADAAKKKTILVDRGDKKVKIGAYEHVHVIENQQ